MEYITLPVATQGGVLPWVVVVGLFHLICLVDSTQGVVLTRARVMVGPDN